MQRFLKEPGGIDQYPDVKIEWIFHHNPDLFVFEGGKQVASIDLSRYDYDALHTLFKQHFRTKAMVAAGGDPPEASTHRALASDGHAPSSTPHALLHDADAPQPSSGWRFADSLAELGIGTTVLFLLMLFSVISALALFLPERVCKPRQTFSPAWHNRPKGATDQDRQGACHIA